MAPSKKYLKNPYPMNRGKMIKFVRNLDWWGVAPSVIPLDTPEAAGAEHLTEAVWISLPKQDDLATILSRTKNGWLKVKIISDVAGRHGRVLKIRNMPKYVDSLDRIHAAKKILEAGGSEGNQGIYYDHEKGKLMGTEHCEPGGEHILFAKKNEAIETEENQEDDFWPQLEENVELARADLLLELQQENDALKSELDAWKNYAKGTELELRKWKSVGDDARICYTAKREAIGDDDSSVLYEERSEAFDNGYKYGYSTGVQDQCQPDFISRDEMEQMRKQVIEMRALLTPEQQTKFSIPW